MGWRQRLSGVMLGSGVPDSRAGAGRAVHLGWQVRSLDAGDPAGAPRLFKSNRDAGLCAWLPGFCFTALPADSPLGTLDPEKRANIISGHRLHPPRPFAMYGAGLKMAGLIS